MGYTDLAVDHTLSDRFSLEFNHILLECHAMSSSIDKLSVLGDLWAFMRVRKKWWLGPIVGMLLLLGLLLVFTQGSALAPFIYTLF
jgi:hypothetical protein